MWVSDHWIYTINVKEWIFSFWQAFCSSLQKICLTMIKILLIHNIQVLGQTARTQCVWHKLLWHLIVKGGFSLQKLEYSRIIKQWWPIELLFVTTVWGGCPPYVCKLVFYFVLTQSHSEVRKKYKTNVSNNQKQHIKWNILFLWIEWPKFIWEVKHGLN